MPYVIPINSRKRYYVKAIPTVTPYSHKALQFIGDDIPDDCKSGFRYYDDSGVLISDYADYKYFYKHNIYSIVDDPPVSPKPNNKGQANGGNSDSAIYDTIEVVNRTLNEKIDEMKTIIMEKTVYIRDTGVEFITEEEGAIKAQLITDKETIDCNFTREGNKISVIFEEPLTKVGTVMLYIIK